MAPSSSAPNRNHAVSLAKPVNALRKGTMCSAQNRKQPMKPTSAGSVASVAQARIMKAAMAMPCLVAGSSGSGANQMAAGTTTQAMRATQVRQASAGAAVTPGDVSLPASMQPPIFAHLTGGEGPYEGGFDGWTAVAGPSR